MSDSSEDEDLSKFREAVDSSFAQLLNKPQVNTTIGQDQFRIDFPQEKILVSERYLETAAHYNDVKVPEKLQKQIGDKISFIIHKNVEFVDIEDVKVKKRKVKGGVKLFKNSDAYLCCEEAKDDYTANHNKKSKRMRHIPQNETDSINENEKINASVISGDYVLSKDEIKSWKSRRKEKIFKYKSQGNSNVLLAVE